MRGKGSRNRMAEKTDPGFQQTNPQDWSSPATGRKRHYFRRWIVWGVVLAIATLAVFLLQNQVGGVHIYTFENQALGAILTQILPFVFLGYTILIITAIVKLILFLRDVIRNRLDQRRRKKALQAQSSWMNGMAGTNGVPGQEGYPYGYYPGTGNPGTSYPDSDGWSSFAQADTSVYQNQGGTGYDGQYQ